MCGLNVGKLVTSHLPTSPPSHPLTRAIRAVHILTPTWCPRTLPHPSPSSPAVPRTRCHVTGKDATVNGMLDGFEALDPADVKSSVDFINRAGSMAFSIMTFELFRASISSPVCLLRRAVPRPCLAGGGFFWVAWCMLVCISSTRAPKKELF